MKILWLVILVLISIIVMIRLDDLHTRLEKAEATVESLVDWSNEISPPREEPTAPRIISY